MGVDSAAHFLAANASEGLCALPSVDSLGDKLRCESFVNAFHAAGRRAQAVESNNLRSQNITNTTGVLLGSTTGDADALLADSSNVLLAYSDEQIFLQGYLSVMLLAIYQATANKLAIGTIVSARPDVLDVPPVDLPCRLSNTTFCPAPPPPPARVSEARLGVLLPMFQTEAAGYGRFSESSRLGPVYQAMREINNKSDGVADRLLPNTQLLFAYNDSKCDSTEGLLATLRLTRAAFDGRGVHAVIGAACSGASISAAQVGAGLRVPIISPSATSPVLSDGRSY
eukprot:3776923-Prymnesium_polylepis.1